MGIEAAMLAMGASAGVASAVATGATALGAAAAVKAAAPKVSAPSVKALTDADKPKATVKAPDRPAISKANAGGAATGNSGTFLTGPSGVDASTLNLGRNTLLGQ